MTKQEEYAAEEAALAAKAAAEAAAKAEEKARLARFSVPAVAPRVRSPYHKLNHRPGQGRGPGA